MRSKIVVISSMMAIGALSLTVAANAASSCSAALLQSYEQARAVVSSLHADKPGQMRVQASDGSVYTAGETQWLKGQLQEVSQACQQGNTDNAAARLADIRGTLQSHHAAL
jgi:hypothetical protein